MTTFQDCPGPSGRHPSLLLCQLFHTSYCDQEACWGYTQSLMLKSTGLQALGAICHQPPTGHRSVDHNPHTSLCKEYVSFTVIYKCFPTTTVKYITQRFPESMSVADSTQTSELNFKMTDAFIFCFTLWNKLITSISHYLLSFTASLLWELHC